MEENTAKINLAKAILKVMEEVKGIDKNTTIGTGTSQYKGVSDQDVKQIIGGAMLRNGLTILPIDVQPKVTINSWTETGQGWSKQKQSYFTEATTKYLLLHESGESQIISGYGHGVDSQDKAAGKATTYALKYTLLYLFLVPTGKIDDADKTHSDEIPTPPATPVETRVKISVKAFDKLIERINGKEAEGETPAIAPDKEAYDKALKAFIFTEEQRSDLELAYQNKFPK